MQAHYGRAARRNWRTLCCVRFDLPTVCAIAGREMCVDYIHTWCIFLQQKTKVFRGRCVGPSKRCACGRWIAFAQKRKCCPVHRLEAFRNENPLYIIRLLRCGWVVALWAACGLLVGCLPVPRLRTHCTAKLEAAKLEAARRDGWENVYLMVVCLY